MGEMIDAILELLVGERGSRTMDQWFQDGATRVHELEAAEARGQVCTMKEALEKISSGKLIQNGELVEAEWDELTQVKVVREAMKLIATAALSSSAPCPHAEEVEELKKEKLRHAETISGLLEERAFARAKHASQLKELTERNVKLEKEISMWRKSSALGCLGGTEISNPFGEEK